MSEYKRQVVDVLDFERIIHQLMEQGGKPQFNKGLRKAQLLALELARPYEMQRTAKWYQYKREWHCSICDETMERVTRYCPGCGCRMLNYETEKENEN